jgi:hypothetical protein
VPPLSLILFMYVGLSGASIYTAVPDRRIIDNLPLLLPLVGLLCTGVGIAITVIMLKWLARMGKVTSGAS